MMLARLLCFHPEVSGRSCADCQKHVYRDGPEGMGEQVRTRDANGRMTLPMARRPNSPLPCGWCPKIPTGEPPSPRSAIEPSERSWAAYRHYRECVAVGFSEKEQRDPIVRRNAAIIRRVEDQWQRRPLLDLVSMLPLLAARPL